MTKEKFTEIEKVSRYYRYFKEIEKCLDECDVSVTFTVNGETKSTYQGDPLKAEVQKCIKEKIKSIEAMIEGL